MRIRLSALALLLLFCLPQLALQQDPAQRRNERQQERERRAAERDEARRLEKLDAPDRAALQALIGYQAPEFTGGLDWMGEEAPAMRSLRGRVVVIQTFTTRNTAARALPARVAKALAELGDGVQLITIHTPEGADRAETQLTRGELPAPTALDRDGEYCDAVGAFKRPVNIVVDRTGNVRFAGLTVDGIVEVARELAAEPYDPANKPTVRRAETTRLTAEFPTYQSAVRYALDLRGKPAPQLGNVNWWNGAPRLDGRLVIVEFWATSCAPCRQSIPHMSALARDLQNDIVCAGISNESSSNFDQGLRKHNLRKSDFGYSVGVDPGGSMMNGFSVKGIPHVAIISSDGIVRWQGSPSDLNRELLRPLVEANRALAARSSGGGGDVTNRWKRELENEGNRGGSRSGGGRRGY